MANIPKTCRAVVLDKPGDPFAVRDISTPQAEAGEVLIKVHACGVCWSDYALQQGFMGPLASFPVIPGHEVIGSVVALGAGVSKWKLGDVVGGPWHGAQDGTCRACTRGQLQFCENQRVNGVNRNGGYSEYTTLNSEAAVRMPAGTKPADYAPLLCAGVTVFNGIRSMKVQAPGLVAVQGLGGLGHLAVQYARKMGYRTVALSRGEDKRAFATQLGATDYIDTSAQDAGEALQALGGADLVVATAPNAKTMPSLIQGCGTFGKVMVLAPVGDISVSSVTLVMKGVTVCGWASGHALDCEEAVEFAELQGVECMVEKFPLERVGEAVQRMESGQVRFRSVLVMD